MFDNLIGRHKWVKGFTFKASDVALESTPTFYELYTDKSGQVIDGHTVRVFFGNDEPRYARIVNKQFKTYGSQDLTPVAGTEY